jgi:hydroxysqualene synthase
VASARIDRAYAACEALARSHYENFPVASWLVPRRMRPHIAAVYAFARVADDIADEGKLPADERRIQLDAWQRRLHAATAVEESAEPPHAHEDLIIVAAAHTIRTLDLPIALFDDLVSAFGQDITTTRYASWRDVLDYCRRSANPVGRLVLGIAGYRLDAEPRLAASSDALCTALQLTNFWQDLGRDWANGRLYVPQDVAAAYGACEADLGRGPLPSAWVSAIGDCVRVTLDLFQQGRFVCDCVRGRLRYELRATWAGGRRILEQVERLGSRLLADRPVLRTVDAPILAWRVLRWRTYSAESSPR